MRSSGLFAFAFALDAPAAFAAYWIQSGTQWDRFEEVEEVRCSLQGDVRLEGL
jgi:hypothetical protein